MTTSRVDLRLPDALIEKADIAATVTNNSRDEIVEDALREYLDEIEDDKFRENVVELYLDGTIDFEGLVEFIGRQDAEAVRTSKPILDCSDDLDECLVDL